MARDRARAAAIIIRDNQILLMHRRKKGYEYWVLPGGGIEEGESPEGAVVREVKEETNLDCTKVEFAFEVETYEGGNMHPFFFCEVSDGEVSLGGPEAIKMSEDDWYNPEWVEVKKINELNLLPQTAKLELLKLSI